MIRLGKPTITDKLVGYFNPVAGVRRRVAREIMARGSYSGASRSRKAFSGWKTPGDDADSALLPDLPTLRDRCHDLVRNAPLATGAIHTKVTNIVGTGLRLQSRIDRDFLGLSEEAADAWERQTEREFRLWSESQECDSERTKTFHEMQDLVMRSALVSGDVFVTLPYIKRVGSPYGLKLQVIEADRVTNPDNKMDVPKLAGGVEKDAFGAPTHYHIMTEHPGGVGFAKKKEWLRVAAFGSKTGRRNVLHLYRKLRPGQTRGVPDLAPVIELLKQLDRYTEAEIMAAVVSAMFTIFIKTEGEEGLGPVDDTKEGKSTANDEYKMGPGAILDLDPKEDIVTANPSRPNTAFDPFVQAILEQIGVALELPFEVIRGHFSASYSASRAALLEAWKMFRSRRRWLTDKFCRPVYETWLTEAVALGRVSAPGFLTGDPAIRAAYLGSDWVGPSQGQLDPLKEAKAAQIRIDEELSSRSEEAAALGGDWERIHQQRAKEERMRREDKTIMSKPGQLPTDAAKADKEDDDED